jgi:hypothetical protein
MDELVLWCTQCACRPILPPCNTTHSPITLRQPKIVQFTTASALDRQRFLEQTTVKPTDNINIHDMFSDINLNSLTKDELIDLLLLRRETNEVAKRDGDVGGTSGAQPAPGGGQQTGFDSRAGERSGRQCETSGLHFSTTDRPITTSVRMQRTPIERNSRRNRQA